jgi:hypothetical protein
MMLLVYIDYNSCPEFTFLAVAAMPTTVLLLLVPI